MNNIEKLNRILMSSSELDVWSDVDLPKAGELLNKLNDIEWKNLIADCDNYTISWRKKIAQACIYSDNKNSMQLLVKLIRSDDSEVGILVAEMLIEKNYKWNPEESIVEDLKRHLKQSNEEQKKVLERLIGRLPS